MRLLGSRMSRGMQKQKPSGFGKGTHDPEEAEGRESCVPPDVEVGLLLHDFLGDIITHGHDATDDEEGMCLLHELGEEGHFVVADSARV